MAVRKDWWPSSRDRQMAMAHNWKQALDNNGELWGVKVEDVSEFAACTEKAAEAKKLLDDKQTRTPVIEERFRELIEKVEEKARYIKRRYFHIPPLQREDFISLGLKIPDRDPTPTGTPTAQAAIKTFLSGRHELGIEIFYVNGDLNDPANKSFRVYYKVIGTGEEPPADPEELAKSFTMTHKKRVIPFSYLDSGKTCYVAVQIENGGKKGPWGPMVSAVIP